jgi:hypothetical protein
VISHINKRFRETYAELPEEIQKQAQSAYRLFRQDPFHPSLRFKQVHPTLPVFSARVGLHYRAVGIRDGDEIIWFWIGPHADYDKLVKALG